MQQLHPAKWRLTGIYKTGSHTHFNYQYFSSLYVLVSHTHAHLVLQFSPPSTTSQLLISGNPSNAHVYKLSLFSRLSYLLQYLCACYPFNTYKTVSLVFLTFLFFVFYVFLMRFFSMFPLRHFSSKNVFLLNHYAYHSDF